MAALEAMGSPYTNFHVAGRHAQALTPALWEAKGLPAYVSIEPGRWTSVYPRDVACEGEPVVGEVAEAVSTRLACSVLAFCVADTTFEYQLFEDGRRVDEYVFTPGRPAAGLHNLEALLRHCVSGARPDQLRHMLEGRVDGPGLSRETMDRLREEIDRQRRLIGDQHPDLASRLRALGAPTPALERMLRRFDAIARQSDERGPSPHAVAEAVGRLIGLPAERCLVGYVHLSRGEAPPGMVFHVGRRS